MVEQNNQVVDIYLIRHGKTLDNIRKVSSGGDTDPELLIEGIESSKKLRGIYNALLEKEKIKNPQIVTTNLLRTKETAAAIINSNKFIIDDGFSERKSGKWVGVLTERLYNEFKEFKDYKMPGGGENIAQHKERIAPVLNKWIEKAREQPVFIVSHAGSIRRMAELLTGDGKVEIENSSISRARSIDGGKTWKIKQLTLENGEIKESPLKRKATNIQTSRLEDILKDNKGSFSLDEKKNGQFVFTITPARPGIHSEAGHPYKSESLYIGKLADDLGKLLISENYINSRAVKKDDKSVSVTLTPMQAEILTEFARYKNIEIPQTNREYSTHTRF